METKTRGDGEMKRTIVVKHREELVENNCIEAKELDNYLVEEIYEKFIQVKTHESDFGEREWSIAKLDTILEERKKFQEQLNQLRFNGWDQLGPASNSELNQLVHQCHDKIPLGFKNEDGWSEDSLIRFSIRYDDLFNELLDRDFGGEYDISTPTLPIDVIEDLLKRTENIGRNILPEDWTIQDLLNYESGTIHTPSVDTFPKITKEFEDASKKPIAKYINENKDNLVAGVLLVLDFPYVCKFSHIGRIGRKMKNIIQAVIDYAFNQLGLHFWLKVDIEFYQIDMETQEISPGPLFKFPKDAAWSIDNAGDIAKFKENLGNLFDQLLDSKLDTSRHLFHEIRKITTKLANRRYGGCKGFKNPWAGQKKYCVLNPECVDDLCFWRCLAISLYEDTSPNITKTPRNTLQKNKAIELRNHYYNLCEVDPSGKDTVALDQIPDICEKLEINIEVNTIQEIDSQKKRVVLMNEKSTNPNAQDISLHYDEQQKHFMVFRTPCGYADKLVCKICGQGFSVSNSGQLKKHELEHDATKFRIEDKLVFKKELITHKKTLIEEILGINDFIRPFFLCYDFEALLVKLDPCQDNSKVRAETRVFTRKHQPIAFVLKGWSADKFGYQFSPVLICGEDCDRKLIQILEERSKAITDALYKHLFRTYKVQWKKLCEKCCDCGVKDPYKEHKPECKFRKERRKVVKEYIQIPILGFNSGRYDITFITKHMINKTFPFSQIISKSNSYMKLGYGNYVFLDAMNYVPPEVDLNRFGEMWGVKIKKGIFPYDWFDSIDKLKQDHLPPISDFHNKLKNEVCKTVDYDEAVEVWKTKKFQTFEDYMMYYCELDVDVLLQGLVNFRKILFAETNLDALNFVSISSIAYADAFKNFVEKSEFKLYTIENQEIYEDLEKSMYGGACQVFDHYGKVGEDGVRFMMCLDENALYGCALTKPLPYGDFEQEIENEEQNLCGKFEYISRLESEKPYEERYSTKYLHGQSLPDDPYNFTGYLRCAIYFTEEQKNRLKDFPPLPTKIDPNEAFTRSKYMEDIRVKLNLKETHDKKLVYGLFPLPDYVIFSEMLKYLLENRMCVLGRVYTSIQMPLGYVFRDFVNKATKKRQEAADMIDTGKKGLELGLGLKEDNNTLIQKGEAQKGLNKIKVNSYNGKTIQSERKYNESCIVRSADEFLSKTVKHKVLDFNVLAPRSENPKSDGLVELKLKKKQYKIASPRYIGCTVFWISKMIVLDFVYNCLYTVYSPDDVKIMYMDTDSLYLKFLADNAPKSFEDFISRFSPILRERHFPKDANDIAPGKMKCEKIIADFPATKMLLYKGC